MKQDNNKKTRKKYECHDVSSEDAGSTDLQELFPIELKGFHRQPTWNFESHTERSFERRKGSFRFKVTFSIFKTRALTESVGVTSSSSGTPLVSWREAEEKDEGRWKETELPAGDDTFPGILLSTQPCSHKTNLQFGGEHNSQAINQAGRWLVFARGEVRDFLWHAVDDFLFYYSSTSFHF